MRRREMVVFTQIITRTISEDTAHRRFLFPFPHGFRGSGSMICKYIDVGVVGSGMGLSLIVGHLPKIPPQNSKEAS
jgi:hypothetical protein